MATGDTDLNNFITIGNALSALMGPAFVNHAQFLSLVRTEPFPDTSNVLKVPIGGYLTAANLGELSNYSYSASPTSELLDTSVSCTAEKAIVGSRFSVEADRFAKPWANLPRIATEQGSAHGRLFDANLKTLFSSVTNVVTATTTMTKDNILDALYNIQAAMKGAFSGSLVMAGHYKAVSEIRKELTSITATAFSNMELLGLIGKPTPGKNYVGNFAGVDVYQTDGLPTTGGDNISCVWDPMHAFYAGVDGINGFRTSLKEPSAINGVAWELLTWTFFKVIAWRDTAACAIRSDT